MHKNRHYTNISKIVVKLIIIVKNVKVRNYFKLITYLTKYDNKSKSNIYKNGRPTPLMKIKGHMEYVKTH